MTALAIKLSNEPKNISASLIEYFGTRRDTLQLDEVAENVWRTFPNEFQTRFVKNNHCTSPNMIFDFATGELKHRSDRIVFKPNNKAQYVPSRDLLSNFGTMVIEREKQNSYSGEWLEAFSTQITGSLDFWSGKATLSDYEMLVDDYDVSEVEEIHMQAATKYGW